MIQPSAIDLTSLESPNSPSHSPSTAYQANTTKMHVYTIILTLLTTYLALLAPSLAHSCPYPKLAGAYCCKTTALTIVEPHPGQDLGIHVGEDCTTLSFLLLFLPSKFWIGGDGFVHADVPQAREWIRPCTSSARIWVQWGDGSLFVHLRRLVHLYSCIFCFEVLGMVTDSTQHKERGKKHSSAKGKKGEKSHSTVNIIGYRLLDPAR